MFSSRLPLPSALPDARNAGCRLRRIRTEEKGAVRHFPFLVLLSVAAAAGTTLLLSAARPHSEIIEPGGYAAAQSAAASVCWPASNTALHWAGGVG